MIARFDTFEDASRFVEEKRAAGYEAKILNESVGFLWGPRAVGGFRVEYSEEQVTTRQEPEAPESIFTRGFRSTILLFLGFGVLSLALLALTHPRAVFHLVYVIGSILLVTVFGGFLLVKLLEKWFPNRR
ncbi:MAG: hypothetical protein CMO55_03040 [Verrucomicrobiales bacterium]|nr:hypothetical protein [Verrucomicrobiales bacterium]